jgi:hypothetical protein
MTREGKEREVTRNRKEVEHAGKECDLPRKSGRRAGSGNEKRRKGKRDEKRRTGQKSEKARKGTGVETIRKRKGEKERELTREV